MMTTSDQPVRVRAHRSVSKNFGAWTTSRHFDVRASRGLVVLDLLLPELEAGEIVIDLDVDHALVKLLVPDGAIIDDDDLRRVGNSRVKDWTGVASQGGQVIRLTGELRRGEVRVHRGGIAIVGLVLAGKWREVRAAHSTGRLGEGKQ